MNWHFTRPGRIRFEKGEPFCFVTLTPHRVMDQMQPVLRSLPSDVAFKEQYEAWRVQRDTFNRRLDRKDPDAIREAWQRFYFKGEIPEDKGAAPADHMNKRRLKPIKLGR